MLANMSGRKCLEAEGLKNQQPGKLPKHACNVKQEKWPFLPSLPELILLRQATKLAEYVDKHMLNTACKNKTVFIHEHWISILADSLACLW